MNLLVSQKVQPLWRLRNRDEVVDQALRPVLV